MRNNQEQVEKALCYQKLFWPFTVWINCSSDLNIFANSRPSASNFKSFSRSLEQFFLTVGQNNFGNKIPFHTPLTRFTAALNCSPDFFQKLRVTCIFCKSLLVWCISIENQSRFICMYVMYQVAQKMFAIRNTWLGPVCKVN